MGKPIQKVAILGAGVMGAGIAAHLSAAGILVDLLDMAPTMQSKEQQRNALADNGVKRAIQTKAFYDKNLSAFIRTGNFEDNLDWIQSADAVIEVVVEKLAIKKQLYNTITPYLSPDTIIASNTSGISINKMAESLPDAYRKNFLGVHFFNPPRFMKLVEIIPSQQTDPDLVTLLCGFIQKRLGKGVVIAKDTPNFIANRIGVFSSVRILQLAETYGLDFTQIDRYTGPFIGRSASATCRTSDMVGLDTMNLVVNSVRGGVPESEKEFFQLPQYFNTLLENGQLGDKTKQGFFKREKKPDRKIYQWNPVQNIYEPPSTILPQWVLSLDKGKNPAQNIWAAKASNTPEGNFIWDAVKATLLYSAGLAETITDDFRKIDLAMQWGYNWAMGPFTLWDAMGAHKLVAAYQEEGAQIPKWVLSHLNNNDGSFFAQPPFAGLIPTAIHLGGTGTTIIRQTDEVSLYDIGDHIACIAFHAKGNSISKTMVDEIRAMTALAKERYDGLIIGNEGKNFCAGADLKDIATLAQAKDFKALDAAISNFQQMTQDIKYFGKPVVAAPFGMTLGGGCELCMHATATLAQAETYMGLVEVGVGLIPGGGGTKEMALRVAGFGADINGADNLALLLKLWGVVAGGKVSGSGFEAFTLGYLNPSDKVNMDSMMLLNEAKELVIGLNTAYRPTVKQPVKVLGNSGIAAIQVQIDYLREGNWASAYDAIVGQKVAEVIAGGKVAKGSIVTEDFLLDLEREAFLSLAGEEKTTQRIAHMLKTGKVLRN